MRQILLILLFFYSTGASAQTKKSFFDRVYFSAWAGNQVYRTDRSEWKNMYADRSPIPYLLDTMQESFEFKEWFFPSINAKTAASVNVAKRLTNTEKKWWSKRELEWRSGINFKSVRNTPSRDGYQDNFNYPADTTKVHYRNFVRLQQNKQLLEWQNLLNFKTSSFPFKNMRFIIGNGFGISRTLKNTIHEDLSTISYTWDTARHYFVQKTITDTESDFKGKPETSFSYMLYVATEYKLSANSQLSVDFNYTLAHYKYSVKHPKIEGYWLGLTFGYSFEKEKHNKKR